MRRSTVNSLLLVALGGACIYTLSACSTANTVGTAAGSLVQRYCDTPKAGRAVLRHTIAASTAPNKIRVECAADAL